MGDACSKNKSKQVKQLNFEFQSPLQIYVQSKFSG